MKAIFFDADEARLVVAKLTGDGFAAELVQEKYAGEDDDEDHPWAVVSDAPGFLLELYVDEYDGWLDDGTAVTPSPSAVAPIELPGQPIRIKRPEAIADPESEPTPD